MIPYRYAAGSRNGGNDNARGQPVSPVFQGLQIFLIVLDMLAASPLFTYTCLRCGFSEAVLVFQPTYLLFLRHGSKAGAQKGQPLFQLILAQFFHPPAHRSAFHYQDQSRSLKYGISLQKNCRKTPHPESIEHRPEPFQTTPLLRPPYRDRLR